MARELKSDRVLFVATILLVGLSVVMVYSASALVAFERFHQPYMFVTRQAIWAAIGMAILSIVMRIDYRTYRNDKLIWTLLGVVALLLVAVLFSRPINNAKRWVGLGGFGIQPSELAKLAAILFTAYTLERRRGRINEISYSLLPIAVIVGGLVGLAVTFGICQIAALLVPSFPIVFSFSLVLISMLVSILTGVVSDAKRWLELGGLFVAVGNDSSILARESEKLLAQFRK